MKHIQITKILFVCASLLFSQTVLAEVTFRFSSNSTVEGGASLKSKMESNVSALLSEIDRAGRSDTALLLDGINMEPGAIDRLTNLWKDAHFKCNRDTYTRNCINDSQGYQVRDIDITILPLDDSYDQSLNRDLTISLDKGGMITGVRFAQEGWEGANSFYNNSGVADARMRMELLKWVEDFRCYYNEKNLPALETIYSDDAIIITGSVMQRRTMGRDGVRLEKEVKYTQQTKGQYIDKLRRIFKNNRNVNVAFDNISVMRHGAKPNIYGVTVHQTWKTDNYMDNGWLFLLWDFSDEDHPQIYVRTWQDEKDFSRNEVFDLYDFFLP